jgi:BASS family bile acid:Na+ symporter
MQSNLFTAVLLPIALALVMLGMGLSLVPEDFKRITRYPKAVAVGTVSQVLLLPLIGALITQMIPMEPAIAVGLLVLAVCPGGASSHLITYLLTRDFCLTELRNTSKSRHTLFNLYNARVERIQCNLALPFAH